MFGKKDSYKSNFRIGENTTNDLLRANREEEEEEERPNNKIIMS